MNPALSCPRCRATVAPGDRFCADCGARIAPPDAPADGGHAEAVGSGLAGQTDPGLVHAVNEDAFLLSGPPAGGVGSVAVVCDGVSNSQTPQIAAATAARAAHTALAAARARNAAPEPAMREAIRLAHEAVCALPFDRQAELDPPAATIVAAWLHAEGATLGWLGDSRAYALDAGGGRKLTRDHSWLQSVVDAGSMSAAEARHDPRAHALLHCLGTTDFSRASKCPEPGVATTPVGARWLLLCSDGLWNYAETPGDIARAASEGVRGEAADLCARLVAFARAAGGRDNVTVVAIAAGPDVGGPGCPVPAARH